MAARTHPGPAGGEPTPSRWHTLRRRLSPRHGRTGALIAAGIAALALAGAMFGLGYAVGNDHHGHRGAHVYSASHEQHQRSGDQGGGGRGDGGRPDQGWRHGEDRHDATARDGDGGASWHRNGDDDHHDAGWRHDRGRGD